MEIEEMLHIGQIVLRAMVVIPSAVNAAEELHAAHTGEEKRKAALESIAASLKITDAVAGREIVDPERFTAGLGQIVDGVVACMNAGRGRTKS